MAQWSTLMPCNREAASSNLSGVLAFFLKGAHYEVDYSGKKTYLAGLQCTLTSSCAKTLNKFLFLYVRYKRKRSIFEKKMRESGRKLG